MIIKESQGKIFKYFKIFLEEPVCFVDNYLLPCHMCKNGNIIIFIQQLVEVKIQTITKLKSE